MWQGQISAIIEAHAALRKLDYLPKMRIPTMEQFCWREIYIVPQKQKSVSAVPESSADRSDGLLGFLKDHLLRSPASSVHWLVEESIRQYF